MIGVLDMPDLWRLQRLQREQERLVISLSLCHDDFSKVDLFQVMANELGRVVE